MRSIIEITPVFFHSLGFPTPAAYAAYTGRGYSSYPGFGLPSGIAGYPAGKCSGSVFIIATLDY